ncbi:MAG: hypothetical protein V2A69_15995 [Pseudomonadota bacterium]
MANLETYKQQHDAVGADLSDASISMTAQPRYWRTSEDEARIDAANLNEGFYYGRHYQGDGGPWVHPYGQVKASRDKIPYIQENLLAKISRVYADLLLGEGIIVTSERSEIQDFLDALKMNRPQRKAKKTPSKQGEIWAALVRASFLGFVGLQPIWDKGQNRWNWAVIDGRNLYVEFHPAKDEIIRIRKCILFEKIRVADKIMNILYEETHTRGAVETRLYEVKGRLIVRDLDLSAYKAVDSAAELVEYWQTGLDDFMISLLFCDLMGRAVTSDYTSTILKLQEALNRRVTQIDRILTQHGNPKLMVDRQSFIEDKDTGEAFWPFLTSEVLGIDGHTTNPSYLTWDGQIDRAEKNRDDTILALLTEADVAPQLLSFTQLVGGTTADTAAKLEKMLHATIKRAAHKQEFLDKALSGLIGNLLLLSGFVAADFSIEYPEFIPQGRDEILAEVLERKRDGLLSTLQALMWLDDISEEDAQKELERIENEKANSVANPFRSFETQAKQPEEEKEVIKEEENVPE